MDKENELDPQGFLKGDKPDILRLITAYEETKNDLGSWVDQQTENYRIRHSLWAGQSEDGRKHGSKASPAFPWEGASDIRTMIVDQFVTADVALLCTALKKANIVGIPIEASDMKRAKLVTAFMRWLVYSQMRELDEEAELLANYYLEKGIGALGIFWETKVVPVMKDFTIENIQELAPDLAEFISDREYASDLTDMMQMTFPELSRRKARKMVTELRNTGRTKVGVPEVQSQRPVIRAYSLDRDLFIPAGTTDIQKAPYIWKEDWFTIDQLRAKVATEGWDEEFVEHVIEVHGATGNSTAQMTGSEWDSRYGVEDNQKTENIRLVCAYYKTSDEDGLPETWYTIFCPDVSWIDGENPYAVHERLDYHPARYPFVLFGRERLSRRVLETRGYPEIAKGWQDQVKVENDTRIDRSSLATNPPFLYPAGRGVEHWGPGAKIPYRRRDDYGWAEIPQFDQGSIEVENMLMERARKYFGRVTSEIDKVEAQAIQNFRVQKWLKGWAEVMSEHVWNLYKQYGQDDQFFRVVGVDPAPKHMVKGNEEEKYDFYVAFDVPGLDPEYNLKKLESILDAASKWDRGGITDFNEAFRRYVAGVDPAMAEGILMPQEEAAEKEVEEEQSLLTKMWAGFDVDLEPPFNVQVRDNVFQSWLTGSETIPAKDVQERLESDESFAARVEKHQQQIQMQQMQEQNAQIGRTGAPEGNA